jgi:DNA-binding winged helix-turn-helix (wHTH) protein/TolB-like protein
MAETSLNSALGPAAQRPAQSRMVFGPFTLDLTRGELRRDEQVIPLRPKAFDLLVFLASRPGEVLAKDRLIATVWHGVVVTDDSLTQCVHELRSALGDVGAALVRTVPRRGYRFDADVRAETTPAAASAPAVPATPAVPITPALPEAPTALPARTRGTRQRRAVGLLGGLLLVILLALLVWHDATPSWQSPSDLARAPLPRDVPPLSIIVLPLTLEGEAADTDWLADALHGDLVIEVARLHNSLVIARDTANTYKGKAVDPRQIAREMGVRHVVRGSLRREGKSIHLNLALIDGESGVQRWAEYFDIDRAELARAVGDFAVAIERTLAGELFRSTVERRAKLSPDEVTADDVAMQGFALWYRGVTRENVLAARALFERAVAMDPDSARAWAGIHFTNFNVLGNNWTDDRPAAARWAERAVTHLERLDRDGSYTYSARTFQLYQQRDFPAMLRHTSEWSARYRLPLAFGAHGGALSLNGRFDEAVPALERALRLGQRDPFRAEWQYRLAMAHFGAGRYELARDWSQTAATTTPTLLWPPIHAASLLRLNQREAAQQAFDEHMRRHPAFVARHVQSRVPSAGPDYADMRLRLNDSMRELGMRD